MAEGGLLDDLRRKGSVDSIGVFTLDRRKAQEKMREFQLPDPHQYVLCLIQAAVAGGATSLRIHADHDDVEMKADGWVIEEEFLKEPFVGLFLGQEKLELDAYRELAIGLNAALAMQPQLMTVESGGLRLVVRGPEDYHDERREPPTRDTVIKITQRFSWRLAARLLTGAPEARLVRERACHCPVPLTMNQRRLPASTFDINYRGVSSSVHLSVHPTKKSMQVVKRGVVVCVRHMPESVVPAYGVVHADQVLKNASGTDVVEDERWSAVLRDVATAHEELLLQMARERPQESWLQSTFLQAAAERIEAATFRPGATTELTRTLASIPLFTYADGSPAMLDSIIQRAASSRTVHYLASPTQVKLPAEPPMLAVESTEQMECLKKIFGSWLKKGSEEVRRVTERAFNMERWKQSQGRPRLAEGAWLVSLPFHERGFVGELAVPRTTDPHEFSHIWFYKGSGLLAQRDLDLEPLRFSAAISHEEFTPNFTWNNIEQDEHYQRALDFLRERYEQCVERMCSTLQPPHPDVGMVAATVVNWLSSIEGDVDRTRLADSIQQYPIFPTLSGRLASIVDLMRDIDEFGKVHWVNDSVRGAQRDHRQIVKADDTIQKVLNKLFPRQLTHYETALKREQAELAAMARPEEMPALGGEALFATEFETAGVMGAVGLPLESPKGDQSVVRFLRQRRTLKTLKLKLEVGPVVAVVNCDALNPAEDWEDVQRDAAFDQTLDTLTVHGVTRLAVTIAKGLENSIPSRRLVARKFLRGWVAWAWTGGRGRVQIPPEVLAAPLIPIIGEKWISIQQLEAEKGRAGALQFVTAPAREGLDDGSLVILAVEPNIRQILKTLAGEMAVSVEERLEAEVARRDFYRRPVRPLELPGRESDYIAIRRFDNPLAIIGIRRADEDLTSPQGRIEVYRDGRPLATVKFSPGVNADVAVDSPTVEPNSKWSGVKPGDKLDDFVDALRDRVQQAVVDMAAAAAPGSPQALAALQWVMTRRPGITVMAKAADSTAMGTVCRAKLFDTTDGTTRSLHDVARAFRGRNTVYFAAYPTRGRPLDEAMEVLQLRPREETLLRRLFTRMTNYGPRLEKDEAVRKKRSQKLKKLEYSGGGDVVATWPLQGELVLLAPGSPAEVTLVFDGVPIKRSRLFGELPVGGVVQSEKFEPDDEWESVRIPNAVNRSLSRALDDLYAHAFSGPPAVEWAESYFMYRRSEWLSARAQNWPPLPKRPFLPKQDESLVSLVDVHGEIKKHGRLFITPSSEVPSEPVLVLKSSPWDNFLRSFFGFDKVVFWQPPAPQPVKQPEPPKPPPPPPRTVVEPPPKPPVAPAPPPKPRKVRREPEPARPREKAAAEGPTWFDTAADRLTATASALEAFIRQPFEERRREREALLVALRALLREVGPNHQFHVRLVERIDFQDGVDGVPLVTIDPGHRRVVLNQNHTLLLELARDGGPASVVYLASAVYTALNQARDEVSDAEETGFLADLSDWLTRHI